MSDPAKALAGRRRRRDRLATLAVNASGGAVILLILLILAYLLVVALPLARGSSVALLDRVTLDPAFRYVVAEQDATLWRLPDAGAPEPDGGVALTSAQTAVLLRGSRLQFFVLAQPPGDRELNATPLAANATAVFEVSLGEVNPKSLQLQASGSRAMVAYADHSHNVHVRLYDTGTGRRIGVWSQPFAPENAVLDENMRLFPDLQRLRVWVAGQRQLRLLTLSDTGQVSLGDAYALQDELQLAWGPAQETMLAVAPGGRLLRLDTSRTVPSELGPTQFLGFDPRWVFAESGRRVILLLGARGELELRVPSSADQVARTTLRELMDGEDGFGQLGLTLDGSVLFQLRRGELRRWRVDNPYPETGWRSLWRAQDYAAYDGPSHSWHPDGAAVGTLSKFGLSPLLYGTFKAALYGLIIAAPLSLAAAIYTGYFLTPRRRNQVKPAIEMLEALPTVVLGFIAGLWLAPVLEERLLYVLLTPIILVGVPLLLAAGFLLVQRLSVRVIRRPARVLPVAVGYVVAFALLTYFSPLLEQSFFDGNFSQWLWTSLGIHYEQRNALLVGLCMGVAITPVMFSIIEDSIFAVPRSLSDGSLALGATRWQSLARVVLPAASPAILSAMLIGFARGLGETMIVLLATGNTPLMEMSLLSGLRSLSASIALELPEAAAGGVQFRLLFFAALVLFALTFLLNTVAELFRQRLRYAYANH